MDSTVLKTEKLNKLKAIAHISSINIIERDKYVELAIAIDSFLNERTIETRNIVCEKLVKCSETFAMLEENNMMLVGLLRDLEYLIPIEKQETQQSVKLGENVISILGKNENNK